MQVSDAMQGLLDNNMQGVLILPEADNPDSLYVLAVAAKEGTQDWCILQLSDASYIVIGHYNKLYPALKEFNLLTRFKDTGTGGIK